MHGQRPLVSIRDKEKRALADNRGTIMGTLADLRPSCEAAFISHYAEIRRICRELPDADGAAVIAVDDQGVAAVAFLPRTRETPQVTIVGRHGKAELWLQSSSVALRHIAIVTCPGEPSEPVRYRVLDLRTRSGLIDERGQPLRSFEADGPVFFQLDVTSFMVLPSATTLPWPDDPLQAWSAFPTRTYNGIPFRHRLRLKRRVLGFHDDGENDAKTSVGTVPGVVEAHDALAIGSPVATIEVESKRGRLSLLVDDTVLRAGVLLGRYDRCDQGGAQVMSVQGLSRVHALILQIDGTPYVIDTASTYGIRVQDMPVRVHSLKAGEDVLLSRGLAVVRWRRVH